MFPFLYLPFYAIIAISWQMVLIENGIYIEKEMNVW